MFPKKEGFSKALSRVKQRVDQNLGRSGATRPLSDDSIESERRIAVVQKSMERFNKATRDFTDHHVKPPEDILVKVFQKNGEVLGHHRDLGDLWMIAANAEKQLSSERERLQSLVKSIVDDRSRHVEEQLANIRRMRKDLDNYILDMDAARRRYQQVLRQQMNAGPQTHDANTSSNSLSPPPSDITAEVASAWQKVECARDSLEAEMNEMIAHEYEYGEVLLQFLEEQAAYHDRSCKILKHAIPTLRERLDDSVNRPIFGLALSEHLRLWRRRVSLVIEYCCLHLLKFGKTEEGLFRITAGASRVRQLKAKFNSGQLNNYHWPPALPVSQNDSSVYLSESGSSLYADCLPSTDPNDSGEMDVHALASILKQYLRELPDPLLTNALCEEWTQVASLPEADRLLAVQALLSRLPPENYENLKYLVHFLSFLTQFSDQNRMTPSNVGIVIGPSVMPSNAKDNVSLGSSVPTSMTHPATIVQTFIENVDFLFPGRTIFKPEEASSFLFANKANLRSVSSDYILTNEFSKNASNRLAETAVNNKSSSSSSSHKSYAYDNNDGRCRDNSNNENGSFRSRLKVGSDSSYNENEDQAVPNRSPLMSCKILPPQEGEPVKWDDSGLLSQHAINGGAARKSIKEVGRTGSFTHGTTKYKNSADSKKYSTSKESKARRHDNDASASSSSCKNILSLPNAPGHSGSSFPFAGSPRVVKAFLSSMNPKNSRDISTNNNNNHNGSSKNDTKGRHYHHKNRYQNNGSTGPSLSNELPTETSTPVVVGVGARHVIDPAYASNSEIVGVLDTTCHWNNKNANKNNKNANVDLDVTAVERSIRVEVRRIKSREMRNKFFAESANSETFSQQSAIMNSVELSQDHLSSNGDVSTDVSILVPSLPKSVLVFPPAAENAPSPISAAGREAPYDLSCYPSFNVDPAEQRPFHSSTPSVAVSRALKSAFSAVYRSRRRSVPGFGTSPTNKSIDSVKSLAQVDSCASYSTSTNSLTGKMFSKRNEAIPRATTHYKMESADAPEHLIGSGEQVVPQSTLLPAHMVEERADDPSAHKPAMLPAFQKTDTDGDWTTRQKPPVAAKPQLLPANNPPLTPRRRAPNAPPQHPPPPPPPTTPPVGIKPPPIPRHPDASPSSPGLVRNAQVIMPAPSRIDAPTRQNSNNNNNGISELVYAKVDRNKNGQMQQNNDDFDELGDSSSSNVEITSL